MKSFKQFILLNEGVKELHNSLSSHYHKFGSTKETHALKDYTDSSFDINEYHWEKPKNPKEKTNPDMEHNSNILDSAIHYNKTPHELTLHSGIQYDPRERMNKEGIVHHPAYISTSLKPKVARGFANWGGHEDRKNGAMNSHVLKIKVPKGHPGVYIGDLSHASKEREFLLPRGTNMKHIKTVVTKKPHKLYKMVMHHTHHMEVV